MAANKAPYPSFIKILYHSPFAPHTMIRPTVSWIPTSGGHPAGQMVNWASSTVDVDAMVQAFAGVLQPMFPPNCHLDRYEVWTKSSPTAIPNLVADGVINLPGTTTLVGWQPAVQKTYELRTASNNAGKIILLDSPSDNAYGKYTTLPTIDANLVAMIQNSAWAWKALHGDQMIFFRDVTANLNRRLLRSYHID